MKSQRVRPCNLLRSASMQMHIRYQPVLRLPSALLLPRDGTRPRVPTAREVEDWGVPQDAEIKPSHEAKKRGTEEEHHLKSDSISPQLRKSASPLSHHTIAQKAKSSQHCKQTGLQRLRHASNKDTKHLFGRTICMVQPAGFTDKVVPLDCWCLAGRAA